MPSHYNIYVKEIVFLRIKVCAGNAQDRRKSWISLLLKFARQKSILGNYSVFSNEVNPVKLGSYLQKTVVLPLWASVTIPCGFECEPFDIKYINEAQSICPRDQR